MTETDDRQVKPFAAFLQETVVRQAFGDQLEEIENAVDAPVFRGVSA